MRDDRLKAVKLRKQGKSYTEISVLLGIPKSTLSYWLRDLRISHVAQTRLNNRAKLKSTQALIRRNKKQTILAEKRALEIRTKSADDMCAIDHDSLFLLGVALYWGEGYKKGAEGSKWKCVDFANSDSYSLVLMMRFFREICRVPEDKFRVQIIMHKKINEARTRRYWSKLLKISENQFLRASRPTHTTLDKRKNILVHGTVHIRVYNVDLFHKIIGWIDGVKRQIKLTGCSSVG